MSNHNTQILIVYLQSRLQTFHDGDQQSDPIPNIHHKLTGATPFNVEDSSENIQYQFIRSRNETKATNTRS